MSERIVKEVLIVGAGLTGITAADELRKLGFEGAIRIIEEEAVPPYDKPPLSKEFASGVFSEEEIVLRSQAWYEERKVELVNGHALALSLDEDAIVLANGSRVRFDVLMIATGARARALPSHVVPPQDLMTMRTLDDARRFRQKLRPGRHLLLIGGGVIGMECAATAVKCGCRVTVVEVGPRVMARFVPPIVSEALTALHRSHGVEILENFSLARSESLPDGGVEVVASTGERIRGDFMLVGIGADPDVALAATGGISTTPTGIVVDSMGRTSRPNVYAAGDCAAFPAPHGGEHIRWENWTHARDHAKCVARAMLGHGAAYVAVPWVWSNQYDCGVQVTGAANAEEILVRGDPSTLKFTTLHLDRGQLVGAATVNESYNKRPLQRLIAARAVLSREQLVDETVCLKQLAASV